MLIGARELGVVVYGTVRARRKRSKKEIENISESLFNTLHWINCEKNFISRNLLTTMLSQLSPQFIPRKEYQEDPGES